MTRTIKEILSKGEASPKIKAIKKVKATKKMKQIEEEIYVEPMVVLEEKAVDTEFKLGDVIEDVSCGKRFHFHNQSVVVADKKRFRKV